MAVPVPMAMSRAQLETIRWEHETPVIAALSHRFAIRSNDLELGRHINELLGALPVCELPARCYSLVNRCGPTEEQCALYFGNDRVILAPHADEALASLLHHVNRHAIDSCTRELVIHAAAAEYEDRALLFPGPPGAGKSTLVAGLVRAGLRYLTDEAAALDLDSLEIQPYAKPVCIKPGSQPWLRDLEPVPVFGEHRVGREWWVPTALMRPASAAGATRPAVVIAPRYEAGAATTLVRIRAAEAVLILAENSFNLMEHGSAGLAALAKVVERSRCFRLEVGDLRMACRRVLELLQSSDSGQSASGTSRG